MNFITSLSSAVLSASQAALSNVVASGGVPGLPNYVIGQKVSVSSIWTLYDGVKRAEKTPVTIFECTAPSAAIPAANALRKLRALRHPNVLGFVDGIAGPGGVYIVTERVRPLATDANTLSAESLSAESITFGLLSIATALAFLAPDATHARITPSAIFVTPAGDWRLGAFELCAAKTESSATIAGSPQLAGPAPPEGFSGEKRAGTAGAASRGLTRNAGRPTILTTAPFDPATIDAYQLYVLVWQLYSAAQAAQSTAGSTQHARFPSPTPTLILPSTAPPTLKAAWSALRGPARDVADFLHIGMAPGGFFATNPLVQISQGFDGFALAPEPEQARFMRLVAGIVRGPTRGSLPRGFIDHRVLPGLLQLFEFGGVPSALALALACEPDTSADLAEADGPAASRAPTISEATRQCILRTFAKPDRIVRMALLESLPAYGPSLTTEDVSTIYPRLATGFGDSVAAIREATVKAVAQIAGRLSEKIVNGDLLRHLARAQGDLDPTVRTNTCILIGRLAPALTRETRAKVLVPAFTRALRDTFAPARSAALRALQATLVLHDAGEISSRVLPVVCPTLTDKEPTVRKEAFKFVWGALRKVAAEVGESEEGDEGAVGAAAGLSSGGAARGVAAGAKPVSSTNATLGGDSTGAFTTRTPHVTATEAYLYDDDPIPGAMPAESVPSLDAPPDRAPLSSELIDVHADDGDWTQFTSAESARTRPRTRPRTLGRDHGHRIVQRRTLRVPLDMDASDAAWGTEMADGNGDGNDDENDGNDENDENVAKDAADLAGEMDVAVDNVGLSGEMDSGGFETLEAAFGGETGFTPGALTPNENGFDKGFSHETRFTGETALGGEIAGEMASETTFGGEISNPFAESAFGEPYGASETGLNETGFTSETPADDEKRESVAAFDNASFEDEPIKNESLETETHKKESLEAKTLQNETSQDYDPFEELVRDVRPVSFEATRQKVSAGAGLSAESVWAETFSETKTATHEAPASVSFTDAVSSDDVSPEPSSPIVTVSPPEATPKSGESRSERFESLSPETLNFAQTGGDAVTGYETETAQPAETGFVSETPFNNEIDLSSEPSSSEFVDTAGADYGETHTGSEALATVKLSESHQLIHENVTASSMEAETLKPLETEKDSNEMLYPGETADITTNETGVNELTPTPSSLHDSTPEPHVSSLAVPPLVPEVAESEKANGLEIAETGQSLEDSFIETSGNAFAETVEANEHVVEPTELNKTADLFETYGAARLEEATPPLVSVLAETMEPADEATPSEEVKPVEEAEPIETVKPVEEVEPFEEVKPIEEVKPVEEVKPIEMVKSVETVKSTAEVVPIETVTSVETISPTVSPPVAAPESIETAPVPAPAPIETAPAPAPAEIVSAPLVKSPSAPLSKEEKAARLAAAREERRARMAARKAQF